MFSDRTEIKTPQGFNFWRTVQSHGWCTLPPFAIDKESRTLSRIFEFGNGSIALAVIEESPKGIRIAVQSKSPVDVAGRKEIRNQVRHCLRLDDDLSEFYAEARRHPEYRWISRSGSGRLLRSPRVFEDVVKMMCTTNCSWALTEVMVENLTKSFGKRFGNGHYSFPLPADIAGTTESFLRKNIRSGYRSPFLLKLAEDVAEHKLDLESWISSPLSTEELYREVKSIKGIGDYAAGNILKLLGRYDYLGLDSWVRAQYFELHRNGRRVRDKTIERHYEPYGTWKGLFFWLEMTRQWYDHKFPL